MDVIKQIPIIFLFLTACQPAQAGEWNKKEIAAQVTWQVLHVIDWGQTRNIAMDDRYRECGLAQVFIGERPKVRDVDMYMGLAALLHPLITHHLPRNASFFKWQWNPRAVWQHVTIGASGACVVHNFSVGLRCEF